MCPPISLLDCLMVKFFPAATLSLQVNEAGSVTMPLGQKSGGRESEDSGDETMSRKRE